MASIPRITDAATLVIKTGSALVTDSETGEARREWMASLMADIAALRKAGKHIVLVSSGAVALGRHALGLREKHALRLEEKQAAAACGQVALMDAWRDEAAKCGLNVAQMLLTLDISEQRGRYLNARNTLQTLLELGIIPIVNENDTIATAEIKVGDNDRLAARVAEMAGADALVIFSTIEGFYTADPSLDKTADKLDVIETITADIEKMAGKSRSHLASGGMITKLVAAKLAQSSGCHTLIADGRLQHPLQAAQKTGAGTWILARETPAAARKRWIAGALQPTGSLRVDAGAAKALREGNSLLAAGITHVQGNFQKGDAVTILNRDSKPLGKGLVAYDAAEMALIKGKKSDDFEAILGYKGKSTVIHRDDMVLE